MKQHRVTIKESWRAGYLNGADLHSGWRQAWRPGARDGSRCGHDRNSGLHELGRGFAGIAAQGRSSRTNDDQASVFGLARQQQFKRWRATDFAPFATAAYMSEASVPSVGRGG